MSGFDSWTPEFCLGCDRQTEGPAYCSESCRLADFEKNSASPSGSGFSSPACSNANSPILSSTPQFQWTGLPSSSRDTHSHSYQFQTTLPYPSSSPIQSRPHFPLKLVTRAPTSLSPSSSYGSLFSIQSSATTATSTSLAQGGLIPLSDKARKELREYAMSFDNVRLQRRCSY